MRSAHSSSLFSSRARACVALFACALTLVASGCGETQEIEMDVGLRGEAAANPFLAAERLLTELGREVRPTTSFDVPTAADALVLVGAERVATPSPEVAALEEWIANGGHLVTTVFGADRPGFPDWRDVAPHPLLAPLGVRPASEPGARADSLADERDDWDVRGVVAEGEGRFDGAIVRSAHGGGHLEFDADAQVEPEGRLVVADDSLAATYPVGRGRVTVLANGSFASNHHIGEASNAPFLWSLVDASRAGRVVLVRGDRSTLLSLLWRRASAFVMAGSALVLVWLWHLTRRFGPLIAPPGRRRLAFADHVEASGRFLERHAGARALVEPLRRRVLRAAERDVLDTGQRERLVATLAERSRLEPARVEAALFGPITDDSDSLVAVARDLHTLERAHD